MLANLHEWFTFDEGGVGAVRVQFCFLMHMLFQRMNSSCFSYFFIVICQTIDTIKSTSNAKIKSLSDFRLADTFVD